MDVGVGRQPVKTTPRDAVPLGTHHGGLLDLHALDLLALALGRGHRRLALGTDSHLLAWWWWWSVPVCGVCVWGGVRGTRPAG